MGRRHPLPALSKLMKLGTTGMMTRRHSKAQQAPSSCESTVEVAALCSAEKGALHRHDHHHHRHHHATLEDEDEATLMRITSKGRHTRWDSDRSTTSTASHTTAATCPAFEEDMTLMEEVDVDVVVSPASSGMDEGEAFVLPEEEDEETIPQPQAIASSLTTSNGNNSNSSGKHVHFGTASARIYPQILGDHPYCSAGCPLELSWEFEREEIINVSGDDLSTNSFEEQPHDSSCCKNQWCYKLSAQERWNILAPTYSACECRKACRRQSRQAELRHQRQQQKMHQEFFGGRKLNTA